MVNYYDESDFVRIHSVDLKPGDFLLYHRDRKYSTIEVKHVIVPNFGDIYATLIISPGINICSTRNRNISVFWEQENPTIIATEYFPRTDELFILKRR